MLQRQQNIPYRPTETSLNETKEKCAGCPKSLLPARLLGAFLNQGGRKPSAKRREYAETTSAGFGSKQGPSFSLYHNVQTRSESTKPRRTMSPAMPTFIQLGRLTSDPRAGTDNPSDQT